jgi:isoleucyl-tRNA synthetase
MKDWLQNMGDWCISRRRFWGLPLPFYKCDNCRYLNVIGSLEELAHKAVVPFNVQELYHVDIHRPHIDAHQVLCDLCGKAVSRIKEVGDCWLDAGIVPFSTFNYNLHGRHQNFPFDFAVEMREQVRLWFYSTLVMSVVLEGEAPFKTIMTYDEMRDNKGDKFSKTKGNAPSLDKIIGEYGADVLRYALAEAPTDQSFCFTDEALKKGKKTFNTLWNCLAYFAQYANADKPDVLGSFDYLEPLDFWLIKRLSEYINETNTSLKDYNAQRAIYSFTGFVNDLSTWYIRMKRPVFAGSACEAKTNSYRILYCVLRTVTIAMAPLFPFTAEEIYQKLILRYEPTLKESVHLMSFPTVKSHVINQAVLQQMTDVRDVVQSILSIRNTVKCKVRQPLRKAIVENWKGAEKWQCEMIAQEVNVLEVTTQEAIPEGAFKVTCHNMNVFLNVELDAELKELGAVRELIRAIQDKRKDMGLVVSDKIALFCVTENSVWDMLNKHLQEIVKKTNSDNFTFCEEIVTDNESKSFEIDFIDGKIKIVVVKAYL